MEISEEILKIFLEDKTTGKNIIWATNDYEKISAEEEIQFEQLNLIQPRYEKNLVNKKNRTREKAEIFTPSWICNEQNNLIDEGFKNKTWEEYISANFLEITCGEAPYIVNRYDAVTGEYIPLEKRIGLLDRKFRLVSEKTSTKSEWLEWSLKALKSVYGYEFQGDNLFLARRNIFDSFIEYYVMKFNESPRTEFLKETAEIISWNFWQMDGLKGIIPYSDRQKNFTTIELNFDSEKSFGSEKNFETENKSENKDKLRILCKIKDWTTGEEKDFINLGSQGK